MHQATARKHQRVILRRVKAVACDQSFSSVRESFARTFKLEDVYRLCITGKLAELQLLQLHRPGRVRREGLKQAQVRGKLSQLGA